jgi:mRNA-degrading endonuclease RelE of RelBE toxin-antitoxin system
MEYIVEYEVRLHPKVRKNLPFMPEKVQDKLDYLLRVLRESGPTGPHGWTNYGKLRGAENLYHCHLTGNHAWIACWSHEKNVLTIEVYYVGSHQNAPY